MSMFCYQCQETAKNTGCTFKGVCGKNEEVAKLQDLLIYACKGVSEVVTKGKLDVNALSEVNHLHYPYKMLNDIYNMIL